MSTLSEVYDVFSIDLLLILGPILLAFLKKIYFPHTNIHFEH